MIDYSKGKIYKLIPANPDSKHVYVGTTVLPLSQAYAQLRNKASEFPERRLYKEMQNIGKFNWKIILLENFPCKSKEELKAREHHYIELLRPNLNTLNNVDDSLARSAKNKAKEAEKVHCDLCNCDFARRFKGRHNRTEKHLQKHEVVQVSSTQEVK